MRELAAKYPEIVFTVTADDYANCNNAGQKHGSFWIHVMFCAKSLEDVVADAAVSRFAEFVSGLLRIRMKLIPEIYAFCIGKDGILREQLKQIDIAPFTKMTEDGDQTFLDGAPLGNDTFGISFHLRGKGFKTLIWESNENPQKMSAAINAHPELKAEFPELVGGDERFWWHKDIVPFDSAIDWLKNLQKLLLSLQ